MTNTMEKLNRMMKELKYNTKNIAEMTDDGLKSLYSFLARSIIWSNIDENKKQIIAIDVDEISSLYSEYIVYDQEDGDNDIEDAELINKYNSETKNLANAIANYINQNTAREQVNECWTIYSKVLVELSKRLGEVTIEIMPDSVTSLAEIRSLLAFLAHKNYSTESHYVTAEMYLDVFGDETIEELLEDYDDELLDMNEDEAKAGLVKELEKLERSLTNYILDPENEENHIDYNSVIRYILVLLKNSYEAE